MRPCLIQVEYFHVHMEGSLSDIMIEAFSRTMETLPDALHGLNDLGPGIKTGLRFHDTEQGTITRLALEIESLTKQIDQTVAEMIRPDIGWLRQQLYRLKQRRLRLALKTHLKLLEYAISRQVDRAILAIERVDRHYRLLRDDEKHEVLTRIRRSSRFWIFVFTPNDLLAERNELITAVM